MARPTFYLTTAIDYVNSKPHLGTAYEKVAADAMARHVRRAGYDTFFSMGTDEHSQNVEREAEAQGLTPQEYCDRMARDFEATWKKLDISYDRFIRTTEPAHRKAVEEIFRRLQAKGDVYRARYEGSYCVSCEAFLRDKDLVDGLCPHHKTKPEWIQEENFFFALSRYRDPLLAHIAENPGFILPETRRNEILRLLEGGLEDVSISRSGRTWGIPLPGEEGHVVYVWFDALINYVTSVGFPDDRGTFQRYWPAQLHIIGKDITRFHCIIWPAMLMSAGVPLPKCVFGHGFLSFKGEKMSKSLGHIVSPLEAVDLLGPDPLRYFLLREVVWGRDGDFTWDAFVGRYNSDLANDLGNLVSRTLAMVARYADARVPAPGPRDGGEKEGELRRAADESARRYLAGMEGQEFHAALAAAWDLVRRANRYVEEKGPWALAKQGEAGRKELDTTLYHLLESCRLIALMIVPAMPSKAEELWRALGLKGKAAAAELPPELGWKARWGGELSSGRVVPGEVLFPRLVEETPEGPSRSVSSPAPRSSPDSAEEPGPSFVTFDEFGRLDLRVATVTAAEKVPKSDRLIRLEVTLAEEKRQIVAGIGDQYAPDDLVGKQVVMVVNLKPATIRGVRSEGMLLAAVDGKRAIIVTPESEVPSGSPVE